MATQKPKTLYFTSPVYARGEHIVGEKAVHDDGSINMVRIKRGEKRQITADVAADLIIAKQAIDYANAKPEDKHDAEAFVAVCNEREAAMLKKQAELAIRPSLQEQFEQLKSAFETLKKKAA